MAGILIVGPSSSHGHLGDLIGDNAGTWLSTMSAKMAAISISDTVCAMAEFYRELFVKLLKCNTGFRTKQLDPLSVTSSFFKELKRRASA